MTISIYRAGGKARIDERASINIKLTGYIKTSYGSQQFWKSVKTSVYVLAKNWDNDNCKVVNCSNAIILNQIIQSQKDLAENLLYAGKKNNVLYDVQELSDDLHRYSGLFEKTNGYGYLEYVLKQGTIAMDTLDNIGDNIIASEKKSHIELELKIENLQSKIESLIARFDNFLDSKYNKSDNSRREDIIVRHNKIATEFFEEPKRYTDFCYDYAIARSKSFGEAKRIFGELKKKGLIVKDRFGLWVGNDTNYTNQNKSTNTTNKQSADVTLLEFLNN